MLRLHRVGFCAYTAFKTIFRARKGLCQSPVLERPSFPTHFISWWSSSDQCQQLMALPKLCSGTTDCSKASAFQLDQLLSSVLQLLVTVKHSQQCPHLSHSAHPLLPSFSPSAALARPKKKENLICTEEGKERKADSSKTNWGVKWQQCPRALVQQVKRNPQQCWSKH